MAIKTTQDTFKLDTIFLDGSFVRGSIKESVNINKLDIIFYDGTFVGTNSAVSTQPPTFDTTRFFLCF